jgi:hypothetical protein
MIATSAACSDEPLTAVASSEVSAANSNPKLTWVYEDGRVVSFAELLSNKDKYACLWDLCIIEGIATWELIAAGVVLAIGGIYWIQTSSGRAGPFASRQEAQDFKLEATTKNDRFKNKLKEMARKHKCDLVCLSDALHSCKDGLDRVSGKNDPDVTVDGAVTMAGDLLCNLVTDFGCCGQ